MFNNTYEVDTPLCSAKQLDELREEVQSQGGLGKFMNIIYDFALYIFANFFIIMN